MMGRTHAMSGVPVGLALATLINPAFPFAAPVITVLVTGSVLLPDLDHPQAAASRLLGGFTGVISIALRSASARIYERTKGPRDEGWNGKHRHLTHTIAFALVVGGAVAVLCTITAWAAVPVYMFCALLVADRLGDKLLLWLIGPGIGLVNGMALYAPEQVGWQVGVAVAAGMVTHDLGDSLTIGGCPLIAGLWPFEIAGETWYEIRLLGPLSFRTGSWVETTIVMNLLVGATAAVLWLGYLKPALPALLQLWQQATIS